MRKIYLSGQLATLLACGVAGCSARDLSSLHDGVRAETGGVGGGAGSFPRGGRSAGGGASGSGGAVGFGGAASGGDVGSGGAVTTQLGPWTFNKASDTAEWAVNTGKTQLSWAAQGNSPPLGSMTITGTSTSTRIREVLHVLAPIEGSPQPGAPVDLTNYRYNVLARAATTETTLRLYATEVNFSRSQGEVIRLGTEWTTLTLELDSVDPINPDYNEAETMALGISCGGAPLGEEAVAPQDVWIDSVWLEQIEP